MSKLSRALTATYVLLSIYSLGGGVVEGFVYYPAWKAVGAAEFPAFHHSLSDRLIPAFVLPFFLSVLANLLLAWFRPSELPRRLVLSALALNILIVAATIALAIPIQTQLSAGQSLDAIDRLIGYDRPLRLLPGLLVGALDWSMLYRLLARDRRLQIARRNHTSARNRERERPPPGRSRSRFRHAGYAKRNTLRFYTSRRYM